MTIPGILLVIVAGHVAIGAFLWVVAYGVFWLAFQRSHSVGQLDLAHRLLPTLQALRDPSNAVDLLLLWPRRIPRAVRQGIAGWRGEP